MKPKSQETFDQAIADYEAGVPVNEILKRHGISEPTLRKWRRQAGVPARPTGPPPGSHGPRQRPREKPPVFGAPLWNYDEARNVYVCPENGCGHEITWDMADQPAVRERSDDPQDLTKAMLVLQWEHTEQSHPERISP